MATENCFVVALHSFAVIKTLEAVARIQIHLPNTVGTRMELIMNI